MTSIGQRWSEPKAVAMGQEVLWLSPAQPPSSLVTFLRSRGLSLVTEDAVTSASPLRLLWIESNAPSAARAPSLAGRRIAVMHPDPGNADALAQALRAKGAEVVALSLNPDSLHRAETLDPDAVIMEAGDFSSSCWEIVRALWQHPRLRFATIVLATPELMGSHVTALDVHVLSFAIAEVAAEYARIAGLAQSEEKFEFELERLGPSRSLRALLESGRKLRCLIRHGDDSIEVDLAEHIVVGAQSPAGAAPGEGLLGVHALNLLLAVRQGHVEVRATSHPAHTNVMAPLDTALHMASDLASSVRPSGVHRPVVASQNAARTPANDVHAPKAHARTLIGVPAVKVPAALKAQLAPSAGPEEPEFASPPARDPSPETRSYAIASEAPMHTHAYSNKPGPSALAQAIGAAAKQRANAPPASEASGAANAEAPAAEARAPAASEARAARPARPSATDLAPVDAALPERTVAKSPLPPPRPSRAPQAAPPPRPSRAPQAAPPPRPSRAPEAPAQAPIASAPEVPALAVAPAPVEPAPLAAASPSIRPSVAPVRRTFPRSQPPSAAESGAPSVRPLPLSHVEQSALDEVVLSADWARPKPAWQRGLRQLAAKRQVRWGAVGVFGLALALLLLGRASRGSEALPLPPALPSISIASAAARAEAVPAPEEHKAPSAQPESAAAPAVPSPAQPAAEPAELTQGDDARDRRGNARRASQLVNQGNAFRRKKMLPSARARYLEALRAFPDYPRALAGMVQVAISAGSGKEACDYARQLVDARPGQAPYLLLLGDAYRAAGNAKEAKTAYLAAQRLGNSTAKERLQEL